MHLGGQTCITAYNLEDNELWRRHVLTSLSQVTVAVYVFRKSWSPSANKRLLVAVILLFISGIVKSVDRTLNLKSSSFDSLSEFVSEARKVSRRKVGREKYIQIATDIIEDAEANDNPKPSMPLHTREKIFVDSQHSYADRLNFLEAFWALDGPQFYYWVIRPVLAATFELLYTKTVAPRIGNSDRRPIHYFYVTRASATVLPIVAIGLFHSSNKQSYRGDDVIVTLVLLYGTLVLEFISVFFMFNSSKSWPDMVAQHNLIGFFAHNKKHTKLMSFARLLQCKGLLDQYWCMDPCYSSWDITDLAHVHINVLWTDYIKDGQSYMEFTNIRGKWTLSGHGAEPLLWSIEKPFDESVLLWHIATDFCLHHSTDPRSSGQTRCKQMSNYMMHLLFANPEMLMPGSRKSLFTVAYDQLSDILNGEGTWDDADRLVQKIEDKVRDSYQGTFIGQAWTLAQQLMDIGVDDSRFQTMWLVIQGVWVEMLWFSAGRWRGYLHAKSLGSGGEYLSVVSLLLLYTGMPTLPDRLQSNQPFGFEDETEYLFSGGSDATSSSASGSLSGSVGIENIESSRQIAFQEESIENHQNGGSDATASSTSGRKGTAPELDEIVVQSSAPELDEIVVQS